MCKAIIIAGRFGSGKSTLARRLAASFYTSPIEIGHYVLQGFERQNIFRTPVEFADEIFRNGETTVFAEAALQDALDAARLCRGFAIIVGPRRLEELELFRQRLIVLATIGLLSSRQLRFARYQNRDSEFKSIDYLIKRDKIESEWGLDKVLNACDIRITSSCPTEITYDRALRFIGARAGSCEYVL
jgi:adenylate kinase family enzyme